MGEEFNKLVVVEFDPSSCRGYVNRSPTVEELLNRWYGWKLRDGVALDLVEIAYLLSIGKLLVRDPSSGITVKDMNELVSRFPACFEKFFWPMLTVFKDLRDRGRRVRIIETMKFLVKDKDGDLRLIYILEERSPISVDKILETVAEARRNNLKATIAVVSLYGELTYYEISQVEPRAE